MTLNTDEIDAKIREAQERKELQGSTTEAASETGSRPRRRGGARLSDEERAERARAKEEQKAARKAERERVREEKRQAREAREAAKPPAHMAKVEKAMSKLPSLGDVASRLFSETTGAGLDLMQIEALSQHLGAFARLERTKAALNRSLSVGQTVRIVGGDVRYVGMVGTVAKTQRIRCYVTVPGQTKDVYLFTSDVEEVEPEFLTPVVPDDEAKQLAAGENPYARENMG